MRHLFALAVFVNAALLFSVQPMVGKMVLPLLGGAPAVWNTCMVFFQSALLAGYACAFLVATRLSIRQQAYALLALQLLALCTLPISIGVHSLDEVVHQSRPVVWLLGLLFVTAGPPFLAAAATGPLLQTWFARSNHSLGRDAYSLNAIGNLGSMLALVSYPLLVEPRFPLGGQTGLWTKAFGLLVALTLVCAVSVRRIKSLQTDPSRGDDSASSPLRWSRRGRWVLLAMVPSSLMLGVTSYLAADIGSFPLLWVVPLALYLLTFVVAFSQRRFVPHAGIARMVPGAAIVLTLLLVAESLQPPVAWWIAIHLAIFFVLAMFCHGELANDRPPASHLTEYYLWMAVGGVLGGVFNALIAPLVFSRIWEYSMALVLACLLRPAPPVVPAAPTKKRRRGADAPPATKRSRQLDWLLPLALAAVVIALIIAVRSGKFEYTPLTVGILFGVPCVVCYTFVDRPLRFALGIAAVLLAAAVVHPDPRSQAVYRERSFFGVLSVTRDREADFHQLVHGNTVHGRQAIETTGRADPLSYYHRTGPAGDVFAALQPKLVDGRIAVVGLGIGTLAWYAQPDQEWTFFEIDPSVDRLAHNDKYFRYLRESPAGKIHVVLGDGRLSLRYATDHQFRLIVLDAFSSDAVPVHLLTREALQIYLDKLKPSGVLAFHVSNRYVDLKPVLAGLAADAQLVCLSRDDLRVDRRDVGKDPSQWVVMARQPDHLGDLPRNPNWRPLDDTRQAQVWSDDSSNILAIMRWREADDGAD